MKAALLVLLCAACGGRVDDGDGGTTGGPDASTKNDSATTKDVATPPDVSVKCTLGMGSGTVSSDGSCSSSQSWTCGTVDYSITCKCPDASCTCEGANPKTILTTYACPSCDVMGNLDKLAALCGYPSP